MIVHSGRKRNTRVISLIILLGLLAGFFPHPTLPAEAENESSDIRILYNDSDKGEALLLSGSYAIQFRVASAFRQVAFYIKKAVSTKSELTLSLYAWNTNYGTTVRGTPLRTTKLEGFGADTWLTLDAADSPMPEGEYLLMIHDISDRVYGTFSENSKENTRLYEGASPLQGSLMSRVQLQEAGTAPLGSISDSQNQYVALPDTWTATDGLGRTLPTAQNTRETQEKFVGIFFHTWHSSFSNNTSANIPDILAQNPGVRDFSTIDWGKKFSYFWNEPIYGFYDGKDPWVLRKQAEMLANAGVDVVIFDNTNGTDIFREGLLALLETFAQARADGVKTPQISFLLPMFGPYQDTANQLRQLYELIYSKGRYQDLWFYWKGKPLMMGCPDALDTSDPTDAAILDFFTYRPANPAYREDSAQIYDEDGNVVTYIYPPENHICWQWITTYPSVVARNPDGTAEQVCVSIAQNWSKEQGLTPMSSDKVEQLFGRSYSGKLGQQDTRENAMLYGVNFADQWEFALEVDPEFVFITGWNEWRAGLNEEIWGYQNAFADTFDDEHSRDIEPSTGPLKDHYYYQMVSFIRQFKGVRDTPVASDPKTIDLASGEDQWADVGPYFAAYPGNTGDRDHKGYDKYYYTDETGRNDILGAKVARDDQYLYFMVETVRDLSPSSDPAWMRLFLDVKGQSSENWETFDYVVNRTAPGEQAVLERSTGGWNWEQVGLVDYNVTGNRLELKIPKAMLGLEGDQFALNFKWSDNMQEDGNVMDFYNHGDVAPGGRFKYHYTTTSVSRPTEPDQKSGGKWILPAALAGAAVALAGGGACLFWKKRRKSIK